MCQSETLWGVEVLIADLDFVNSGLHHLFDSLPRVPKCMRSRTGSQWRSRPSACFSALACLRTTNPLYNEPERMDGNPPNTHTHEHIQAPTHTHTHTHVQKHRGKANVILFLDQILLSNPGLWTSGRSSRSGLELRVVLEGFLKQTDRQEASHKLR